MTTALRGRPVAVSSFLDHRSILPAGRPIGPARAYDGYRGAERDVGRFTVRYPGTPPIDRYAPTTLPTRRMDLTRSDLVRH